MPSAAELFTAIIFSTIGLAAFVYGKKSAQGKPMAVGIALMVYPYFISELWLIYAIGLALCAALFLWRD